MKRGGEGRSVRPVLPEGESSAIQLGNAHDIVHALVQRQQLKVGTISEYCTMWSDMAGLAARTQSEAVQRTISNVSLGLDYLAFTQRYDQISEGHKSFIREDIPVLLKNEGIDQVVLSYEDAKLLQLAAAAVNIAYDPGEPDETPEGVQKRTFIFAHLEQQVQGVEVPDLSKVIDIEKEY